MNSRNRMSHRETGHAIGAVVILATLSVGITAFTLWILDGLATLAGA